MPSGAQQMGRGRGASLITSLRWIYLLFFFLMFLYQSILLLQGRCMALK